MDGKEAIINSIIAAAEKKAEAIVADALAEKEELLEKTRVALEAKEKEAVSRAEAEAEKTVARKLTIAELNVRKQLLAAKQTVIDKVYDAAITKTLNMADNVYREFIGGLVQRYAGDGDEIMIAERDAKRLNYDWATSLGVKIGKDVSLSQKYHGGRGGVVLTGYKCDKNLTVETLASEVRDKTEGEIAARLFKA